MAEVTTPTTAGHSGPLTIAAALAGKQLVAEVAAQPGQGSAHRGLAEADPFPRPGHVALGQQCAQGYHQVHVEAGEVHAARLSGRWMNHIRRIDFINSPSRPHNGVNCARRHHARSQ